MARRHVRIAETESWFLIFTPYQPDAIRAIRAIPDRHYEPVTRTWRIPKTIDALRALLRFAHAYDQRAVRPVQEALQLTTLHRALSSGPYATPGWWNQDAHADEDRSSDATPVAV